MIYFTPRVSIMNQKSKRLQASSQVDLRYRESCGKSAEANGEFFFNVVFEVGDLSALVGGCLSSDDDAYDGDDVGH